MRKIQLHCNTAAATSRYIYCKHRHNSPRANKLNFWFILDYAQVMSEHSFFSWFTITNHHPFLLLVSKRDLCVVVFCKHWQGLCVLSQLFCATLASQSATKMF